MHRLWTAGCLGFALVLVAFAQEPPPAGVEYVPRYRDAVIEEMGLKNLVAQQARQSETVRIREVCSAEQDKKKDAATELRSDLSGVPRPASPDAFQPIFHFPPVRQFNTGNCWCFSTTSFFESEINRLTGRKIKLSEMFTVYYEYLEKARRFVQQRGDSFFETGSEGNVVMRVWARYGIVPADAYTGTRDPDGRYDDTQMVAEMKAYLDHVKQHDLWDEGQVVDSLRVILDKYMGRPPEHFVYAGKEMTPRQFLADVVRLNLDDYVCVMSTLAAPFHSYAEYPAPANWWHSAEYYNVPLDEFYGVIRYALGHGYTVRLNGDISEPGHDRREAIAVILDCDIPRQFINQESREFRIANKSTSDDHDVHLVGTTKLGEVDWYLTKDSDDLVQPSAFKGYMLYRDDYIKLKTLTYIVHQDAVRAVVKQFAAPTSQPAPAEHAPGRP